jgi:hypothetical protein
MGNHNRGIASHCGEQRQQHIYHHIRYSLAERLRFVTDFLWSVVAFCEDLCRVCFKKRRFRKKIGFITTPVV